MKTVPTLAMTALMVSMVLPLSAQGPRSGVSLTRQISAALRQQSDLGLDARQIEELETLRSELDRVAESAREQRESFREERADRSAADREEARARADTVMADLQSRFEAAVPPLQRPDLVRVDGRQRRARMAAGPQRAGADGAVVPARTRAVRGRLQAREGRMQRTAPVPARGWAVPGVGRRGW